MRVLFVKSAYYLDLKTWKYFNDAPTSDRPLPKQFVRTFDHSFVNLMWMCFAMTN